MKAHRIWTNGTVLIALAAVLWLRGVSALGADGEPQSFVVEALAAEVDGAPSERRGLLDEALVHNPEDPLARWLSGSVQFDGKWVPFEQAIQSSDQAAVHEEYLRLRGAESQTDQGHIKLANWCGRAGLPERERAHLTAAIERSGGSADPALIARLGQWISREDRRRSERTVREQQRAFDTWRPRLERIARGLASPRRESRERSLAEWRAIEDPAAIRAMEAVFSHRDLPTVHLLIEIYGGMRTHHAAVALARQAVLSPYVTVREAAAEKLRERPIETFAPLLLESLQTPIDSRVVLYVGRNGVRMTRALYRENQDFSELAVLEGEQRIVPYLTAPREGRFRNRWARQRNRRRLEHAADGAIREARVAARVIDHDIELQNASTEEANGRVLQVLRTATRMDLAPTPEPWWQWWLDYNELYSPGEKPQQYTYNYDSATQRIPLEMPMSCLAAGTLVWTDRGAIPVESVQIGDLALARHAETGELAYKPVLRTTVRPATELHKVTAGGDSFLATGGHTFWISGHGCMKIRDAQPGMRFHGATDPVEIESIEPGGNEPTYNLIVADFHTYFVGRRLVLSHDPTFAQPTDVKVPGLAPW
jgi:hypothetical protein